MLKLWKRWRTHLGERVGEPVTTRNLLRWIGGLPPKDGLEAAKIASRLPEMPLPGSLAAKLQQIPNREIGCASVDRQWAQLAHGELPEERSRALRRHLEACQRCAAVYAVLSTVVLGPLAELPGRLHFRLAGIGRPARRPLPKILFSPSYAAAASLLLTVGLHLGLNTVFPNYQQTASLKAPVEAAWQQATQRGSEVVGSINEGVAGFRQAFEELKPFSRESTADPSNGQSPEPARN